MLKIPAILFNTYLLAEKHCFYTCLLQIFKIASVYKFFIQTE